MSALARVLLVDDDPHVLDGLRRLLHSEFAIETANSPELGLERLRDDELYQVIVSDFQMPRMNGAQFLTEARQLCPDTSRLLLTGEADLAGAAAVVNSGGILRLLLKPAGREELVVALHAGVEQHQLIIAERDLLDNTLRGSIRALSDVLALASPTVFARSTRIRSLVMAMADAMDMELSWHVELATMLADIGAIALPDGVFSRAEQGEALEPSEQKLIENMPTVATQILGGIPRIDQVREAILSQSARYDGQSVTDPREGESIPLGGRLLRIARAYDLLVARGSEPEDALTTMRANPGAYDPELLTALHKVVLYRSHRAPHSLAVNRIRSGMLLAADVLTCEGVKLAGKGQELNPGTLSRIQNYAELPAGVAQPISVFLPSTQVELVDLI